MVLYYVSFLDINTEFSKLCIKFEAVKKSVLMSKTSVYFSDPLLSACAPSLHLLGRWHCIKSKTFFIFACILARFQTLATKDGRESKVRKPFSY